MIQLPVIDWQYICIRVVYDSFLLLTTCADSTSSIQFNGNHPSSPSACESFPDLKLAFSTTLQLVIVWHATTIYMYACTTNTQVVSLDMPLYIHISQLYYINEIPSFRIQGYS